MGETEQDNISPPDLELREDKGLSVVQVADQEIIDLVNIPGSMKNLVLKQEKTFTSGKLNKTIDG